MSLAAVLIVTAVLFLIILISLGFQPKFMGTLLGCMIVFCGIAGTLLYGYGYFAIYGPSPLAVMRTLFSVFCMYLGRNEISAVINTPVIGGHHWLQVLLYLVHLMALYATASSVIAGIGSKLLRRLNLLLVYHKDVNIIYGVNNDSVGFAEKLIESGKKVTIFVDSDAEDKFNSKILHMGSLVLNSEGANAANRSFLRAIGANPGKKHLTVYCLDKNTTNNLKFAENLLTSMQARGISPDQTSITVLVQDENIGETLQASGERYGYGTVMAIEKENLIARLLIREYPPYTTMNLNKNGTAAENFEAVIIGFGKTGQAVLRYLLMNGQFEGSNFHAMIIADKYSQSAGSFFYRFPGIKDNYSIDMMEVNARSLDFYAYLDEKIMDLNYIVICTGDDFENNEIAEEISSFIRTRGSDAPVIQCSEQGLNRFSDEDGLPKTLDLFTPSVICSDAIDEMAMVINHQYHLDEGHTKEEDWKECDYFSRNSCRASADFTDALIRLSGSSRAEIREKGLPSDPELQENLARTEHLRWCAFHYANGYRSMPQVLFDARGEKYKEETVKNGRSSIRIGKDAQARLHSCLIPYDDLDDLAKREALYTGVTKDYKKMDLDNVLMIPEMLKKEQESI